MQDDNVMELVRICPLCGKHNPPEETFCACGAMLADVDFTHLGAKPKRPAAEKTAQPAVVQPAAAMVICAHADCAQPNPPGSTRCVYCNRPLAQPEAQAGAEAPDEKQSHLPPVLRAKFRVTEIMPAGGGQADLVLAETAQHEQRVIKIYRKGIKPDWDVLKSLSSLPSANLIKFFEYGEAGGVSWEVMEYCAAGSLRTLLDSGPQSTGMIRRLIAQMSALLQTLHGRNILHRDIKPENILLRAASPLEIALTDFGAASLKMATQYFTDGARTAHYAAPEVLTGVLDEKADWWSLGMIALEAASGKHPYAGLSEQVALHQLATRVVEVKDVFDDRLRMLCRGLLLRNPKRRWGADEVARWLADDETLAMPEESGEGAVVRPYVLMQSQCISRTDLALALVKNWEEGKKDLLRQVIANWVENELRDFNLARDIHDVMARRDLSDDARLLRVILAALPGVPAVWKGKVVTQESLARAAMQAFNDDKESLAWLTSIYKEDVLQMLGERGNADMSRIAQELQRAVEEYRKLWERAKELEAEWRKRPRGHAQEVADVDYLMYLAPIRMNVPSLNIILPDVVLTRYVPAYAKAASHSVTQASARMGEDCGWYAKFIKETQGTEAAAEQGGVFWPVAQRLIPYALEDAKYEDKVQQQAVKNDEKTVSGVVEKIEQQCKRLTALDHLTELDEHEMEQIRTAVEAWLEMNAWAKKLEHKNAALRELTGNLENVTDHAMKLLPALDAHEHNVEIKGIWLQPMRIVIILTIIATLCRFVLPLGILAALAAAAGVALLVSRTNQSRDELADKLDGLVSGSKEFQRDLKKAVAGAR